MPATIDLGPYTVHLDVLAARLRRQRRVIRRLVLLALGVIGTWVLWSLLTAAVRGHGTIVIANAPPDAVVRLTTGTSPSSPSPAAAPLAAPAGRVRLEVTRDGYVPYRTEVTLTRGATTTLTLPPWRPQPQIAALPPPHGAWAWVAMGSGDAVQLTDDAVTTTGMQRTVLRLHAGGIERVAALESLTAPTDVGVAPDGTRCLLIGSADGTAMSGMRTRLDLTCGARQRTMLVSGIIDRAWLAPDAAAVLAAVRVTAKPLTYDLVVMVPPPDGAADATGRRLARLASRPASIWWDATGQAAIVLTCLGARAETGGGACSGYEALLIVRGAAGDGDGVWQAVTMLPSPPLRPFGLPPFAWDRDRLWWTVDTGFGEDLVAIALADGRALRRLPAPPDLLALTALADGRLRALVGRCGSAPLTVIDPGAPDRPLLTLETPLPAGGPCAAVWRGALALVLSDTQAWRVILAEESVQ